MVELQYFDEPPLLFHHDQSLQDPRDGLTLFGPLERGKPEGIRWGVIGTKESIERMKQWVQKIQKPIASGKNLIARPLFPGFEAAFNTRWNPAPVLEREISNQDLNERSFLSDPHQRVYQTVDLFASSILSARQSEDITPDLWCVIIPEYVYRNCRPKSIIPHDMRIETPTVLSKRYAMELSYQPSLFPEENDLAEQYQFEVNFHNQLKARLLKDNIPTQVIRETTIAHRDFCTPFGTPIRPLDNLESAIAWNLATAAFYKAGGKPWKLGAAREGVCYIGLVFKQDERSKDTATACCAAQMFLDSGDGVVFKGAVGPWYRGKRGLYHLDRKAARDVVTMCIQAFAEKHGGEPPIELFLHGRVSFNNEEWQGFQEGASSETHVVGVRIRPSSALKVFRIEDHPVLRGLAYPIDNRKAFLWTRGFVPRLRTYPGREVPNPILVDVCRGDAEIETVLQDILALTKLNYNSCTFADGLPVTLKFANAVGEILTAGPSQQLMVPPLPFKFYI